MVLCGCGCFLSGSGLPTSLKALATEDRPPLSRLEWDGGFFPALRAGSPSFDFGIRGSGTWSGCSTEHGDAFGLTGLAPFGFVLELFVVEEQLFSGREHEVGPAIDALEYLVLEFH